MPLLRWALLGTARINRLVIPAIRATGRSAVTHVLSRNEARARAYAEEWSIPGARASYDALGDADVDVVYVPLPNSLHVEWTIRAVEAGKHVLCEKPLALCAADVDRISAAAARHRRVVAEGFMYRHHAQTLRALELLATGAIGRLTRIDGEFSYLRTRDQDVRLDPRLGGGALWDVGCYPASFANLVAGAKPVSVIAIGRTGPTGVDEECEGTISYANGVDAYVRASFVTPYQTFMRLTGTIGSIEIDRPFRPERGAAVCVRRGAHKERLEINGNDMFVDEVLDIEDAVLGIRPPRVSLAESRTLAATLEALSASAQSGSRLGVAPDASQ